MSTTIALSQLGMGRMNDQRAAAPKRKPSAPATTAPATTTPASPNAQSASTTTPTTTTSEARPSRSSRRPQSNYNSFQIGCTPSQDSAPSYSAASRHKLDQACPNAGREVLPGYTCTVAYEGKFLLQLESVNPIHGICQTFWKDAYVIVRGTMLNIYRVKDNGAGRLIKSYTLQHAEVGLATDSAHSILIPQTRMAHLIPNSARRKAWSKDPNMFREEKQSIMRLRAETDQFILADFSEEKIHDLVNAISAGIDIAYPIDERSIPKQCTVPRRRRGRNTAAALTSNLSDPALLAEQERILRDIYPGFAAAQAAQQPSRPDQLERTETAQTLRLTPTMTHEEDELDLAIMREDFVAPEDQAANENRTRRPTLNRNMTASTTYSYEPEGLYHVSPENFHSTTGKWYPPHRRTQGQIDRYIKRCMPILLSTAVRASDITILNGKRVKINWRMELLEGWELKPPSYRAHHFDTENPTGLERTKSQSSSSGGSATQTSTNPDQERSSANEDGIEVLATRTDTLDLAKVISNTDTSRAENAREESAEAKLQEMNAHARTNSIQDPDARGVVYCF